MAGLDNNTYYPSGNITVAPSSNAVDGGKLYTEYNGRKITLNITEMNYVISPNPGGYDVVKQGNGVFIQPGEAEINGFAVYTTEGVNYRLPTTNEIITDSECYYKGYALLCLHTLFDMNSNLCGNVNIDSTWYCTGIRVEYVSYADYKNKPGEYLLLAGIKTDGTTKINKDKYTRIDAKHILVQIEADEETNRPPQQTANLEEFINNFLKGYWVSKAGDNEYSNLLFKPEPAGYGLEGFDYKTEESPLTSNKYTVGILHDKDDGAVVVKTLDGNNPNGYSSLHKNNAMYFYKGTAQDYKAAPDYSKAAIKFDSDPRGNILSIDANVRRNDDLKSAIHLTTNKDSLLFGVESSLKDIGDKVYATNGDVTSTLLNNAGIFSVAGAYSNIKSEFYTDREQPSKITLWTDKNSARNDNNYCPELVFNISESKLDSTNKVRLTMEYPENIKAYPTKNTLSLYGNLRVTNNIWSNGYIAASSNPSDIRVTDFSDGTNGTRALKEGEVYGTKLWSAVYNDIAEIFEIHPEDKEKIKPGMILAVDENDPKFYVPAYANSRCIVGIVSEDPAFICGGEGVDCGVPVALAGRVKVLLDDEAKDIHIGAYVFASGVEEGKGTTYNSWKETKGQYVGKIVDILDDNTVMVLVCQG